MTGTAYVAVSPGSTLTNNDGTFLFSECTGLVDEADLDYVKELLFAGMTGTEQLTAVSWLSRILQLVYTVRTMTETRTTSYEYDAANRLIAVTGCNGNTLSVAMQGQHRELHAFDAENLATGEKYCYNVYDEVISYTDEEETCTSM